MRKTKSRERIDIINEMIEQNKIWREKAEESLKKAPSNSRILVCIPSAINAITSSPTSK